MSYLTMSDSTKIYFEETGKDKKQTLLFAHGLNSSHLKVKEFLDQFRQDYHVVCYDQRGHEASDRTFKHMNVQRLGQDMHELITYLDLKDIVVIGHSMGAATIFSYVGQYGCDKLKKIVAVDMSPYMRNTVWKGGIGQGKWTDEDFLQDMDRIFNDVGEANWHIVKNMMNPALKNSPKEMDATMVTVCGAGCDTYTMASLWYSLFRTDQRPHISKITVPFMYVMPDTPLYSMETVNFLKENVKNEFVLEKGFPNTTHTILMESPVEVAKRVKAFIEKGN